jgi:hypothetical protein
MVEDKMQTLKFAMMEIQLLEMVVQILALRKLDGIAIQRMM